MQAPRLPVTELWLYLYFKTQFEPSWCFLNMAMDIYDLLSILFAMLTPSFHPCSCLLSLSRLSDDSLLRMSQHFETKIRHLSMLSPYANGQSWTSIHNLLPCRHLGFLWLSYDFIWISRLSLSPVDASSTWRWTFMIFYLYFLPCKHLAFIPVYAF